MESSGSGGKPQGRRGLVARPGRPGGRPHSRGLAPRRRRMGCSDRAHPRCSRFLCGGFAQI